MAQLVITDVGPRDGLQSQATLVSTEGKQQLIAALFRAGLGSVEATSFVSPQAVPQMADAEEVLRGVQVPAGARLSVLTPNLRGLSRALASGAQEVSVVLSATDTMNQKNIRMSLDQALAASCDTLQAARKAGLRTRAYVAVAFACPFEGLTPVDTVLRLVDAMAQAGAHEVVLADTIGAASPREVRELLAQVLARLDADRLGLHLHDTRGMALANAWVALDMGVYRLDASLGGLGGCPFAPGASGNLATEDLLVMAHQLGLHTGIDVPALLQAIDLAQSLVGYPIGGKSLRWLRRQHPSTPAVTGSTTCLS
jgi:hydroxymethylglutaryl-CoA lyase